MERIYHKKNRRGIEFLSIIFLFIGLNQLSAQTETKINDAGRLELVEEYDETGKKTK